MANPDHEQIAEGLEHEADSMERHVRELEDDVEHARAEWKRKRTDPAVPGANPPEEGGEEEPSEQQTPPW